MQKIALSTLALALIAFGSQASAAGKTAKTETKPAPVAMKIDPKASEVKWEGSKKIVKSSHHGTVKVQSGEVQMTGDQITGGSFEIDMTSIANEDLAADPKSQAKLVGHLKNDDFFGVDKHKTANFKIKSVKSLKPAKAGEPTHQITGDLTIKGHTEEISFPAVIKQTAEQTEAMAKVAIDRTKWNIRYGSDRFFDNLGDKVINDQINLDLKLVAKK